jgi:hypothetical protein
MLVGAPTPRGRHGVRFPSTRRWKMRVSTIRTARLELSASSRKRSAGALVRGPSGAAKRTPSPRWRPGNASSPAVVRSLGFRQVGTQEDDVDGLELVFAIAQPAR